MCTLIMHREHCKGLLWAAVSSATDVPTMFWHPLRIIRVHMHSQTESTTFIQFFISVIPHKNRNFFFNLCSDDLCLWLNLLSPDENEISLYMITTWQEQRIQELITEDTMSWSGLDKSPVRSSGTSRFWGRASTFSGSLARQASARGNPPSNYISSLSNKWQIIKHQQHTQPFSKAAKFVKLNINQSGLETNGSQLLTD